MSDEEFGAKLCRAYDAAAEAAESSDDPAHPRHALNEWLAILRGESASGAGAKDSLPARVHGNKSWRGASRVVREALDAAMIPGRSALDSLTIAQAHVRRSSSPSVEAHLRELETYHRNASYRPCGAKVEIAGIERLMGNGK